MKDKTIREMMIDFIIRFTAKFELPNNQYNPVEGTVTYYYKSQCHARVKCAVEIETEQEFVCCDDENDEIGAEDIWTYQTRKWLLQYHTVECGTKCCFKDYHVIKNWDSLYYIYHVGITSVDPPQTYPGTECTSQHTSCKGADEGQPIPCTGDCEDELFE